MHTGSAWADSRDIVLPASCACQGITIARAAVAKRRKLRLANCIFLGCFGFDKEV